MNTIGFICAIKETLNPSEYFPMARLYRIIPMDSALKKQDCRLFIYSHNHINIDTMMAMGHLIEEGQFIPLSEDISDGAIGPLAYTTDPAAAIFGELHAYQYIIRKDTFGSDTVDIVFYPAVDECQEFFSTIEYSINGVPQPGFTGSQIAEIEIREN